MLEVNKKNLLLAIFNLCALQPMQAMESDDAHTSIALRKKQTNLNTQLHNAIMTNEEATVNISLASGAEVESTNHMVWTPLVAAIHYHQNKTVIKTLLASGAQIETKDYFGNTPLMAAAGCCCDDNYEWACNHESICKLLIDHKAQVEERNNKGNTALILAASKGHPLKCKLLIELGAQVETKNNRGVTALFLAAYNGQEEVCKLLINFGAQVNIQDFDNHTALTAAAYNGQEQTCKLLIDHGVPVDAKSNSGNTALMEAVLHNNTALCTALMTYPIFNPFLPEKEFQNSRRRIFTALCALWRACPSLPKDIRKQILCRYHPNLEQDFFNSGACAFYTHAKEAQAPFLPLQVVRLLIQNGKLDKEKTVAAIKNHHFTCIAPLMLEAIPIATSIESRAWLNPEQLKTSLGTKIEYNIKKRLGLLSQTEKCCVQ
jgi:ankyrin repeat protein